MTAFRVYQNELIDRDHQDANRVGFEPITLEIFIDAINAAGAIELAQSLWRRYLDFGRVYELSLQEVGGYRQALPVNPNTDTAASPPVNKTAPLPNRSRRTPSSPGNHQPRATRPAVGPSSAAKRKAS
jgi:hypothetical protein